MLWGFCRLWNCPDFFLKYVFLKTANFETVIFILNSTKKSKVLIFREFFAQTRFRCTFSSFSDNFLLIHKFISALVQQLFNFNFAKNLFAMGCDLDFYFIFFIANIFDRFFIKNSFFIYRHVLFKQVTHLKKLARLKHNRHTFFLDLSYLDQFWII